MLSIESPGAGSVTNETHPVVSGFTSDSEDPVRIAVSKGGFFYESAEAQPHGALEAGLIMLDDGGRDEDPAVEVGEHDLGPGLGTVDAEDAEVLGSDGLDPGMKDAVGLVNGVGAGTAARTRPSRRCSNRRAPARRLGRT